MVDFGVVMVGPGLGPGAEACCCCSAIVDVFGRFVLAPAPSWIVVASGKENLRKAVERLRAFDFVLLSAALWLCLRGLVSGAGGGS